MKKKIEFDSGKKVFPIIVSVIGTALMLAMWITRLNMTAVICVGFCCIVSALIVIGMFFKRRFYLGFLIGYCAALFGVITYYIISARMRASARSLPVLRDFRARSIPGLQARVISSPACSAISCSPCRV